MPAGPGVMLREGEKSTVPALNTKSALSSKFAVRAALPMKLILAEKFSPSSAATSGVIDVRQDVPDVSSRFSYARDKGGS